MICSNLTLTESLTSPVIKLSAPKTKEDDRRAIVRPPHICVLPMM